MAAEASQDLLCWACDAPLGETPDFIHERGDGGLVGIFYCRCREDNRFDLSEIGIDIDSPTL